jgi:uncharacterized protein YbcI
MLDVSNAVVRLYKDALGRGPTKARTQYAGPDAVVVVLEHSLTIAERTLVALGETERLKGNRQLFAQALEGPLRAVVEQTLGRKTIAFVTGIDTSCDVAVLFFTLGSALDGHGAGMTDFGPVPGPDGSRPNVD